MTTDILEIFVQLQNKIDKLERRVKILEGEINPKSTFTPPTLQDVQQYCKIRQNGVDAQKFIDFYKSKNWMIGKSKMADWKAAIRSNWENKEEMQTKIYKSEFRVKPPEDLGLFSDNHVPMPDNFRRK
jgi:hypothetical protein